MTESTTNESRYRSIKRKRSNSEDQGSRWSWIAALIRAPALLALLWPAMLMIAGWIGWHQWGQDYIGQKYYGVDAQLISVTPPPSFVRTDIIQAVYQDADMDHLSLMDPNASAKIASAFATHPWVQRVVGVQKLPGGALDVRLDYRQPVAMVHVISQHPEHKGAGFFAIDGEGILLPPSDFAQSETPRYLHVVVPGAYPTGGVGAPFGDPRVEAAALLARLLQPHRDPLQLSSIGVHGDLRKNPVVQLEIADHEGGRWFWGSPPGAEVQGEPPAAMKLETLLAGAPPGSDLRQLQFASQ